MPAPQKPTPHPQDWHPADIVAAVWKRRTSLSRLSRQNGYSFNALRNAMRRPWVKAEKIIAECIGVPPQQIWPSRYNADGTPKSGLHSRAAVAQRWQHRITRKAA